MTTDNETAAIYILKTIAKARLQPATGELPSATEFRALLSAAFSDPSPPATECELADAALDLLPEDPNSPNPSASWPASPSPLRRVNATLIRPK